MKLLFSVIMALSFCTNAQKTKKVEYAESQPTKLIEVKPSGNQLVAKSPEPEGELLESELEAKPLESQLADTHVTTVLNKKVRMVGLAPKAEAAVANTTIGRSVEADRDGIPPGALCNAILEAKPVLESVLYDRDPTGKEFPDIPYIAKEMNKGIRPIKLAGSCLEAGTCMWNTMFYGKDCLTVADLGSVLYKGSSIAEILALPADKKARILQQQGTCIGPNSSYLCWVSYGDPRANVNGEVVIPHDWSGLTKVNFARGKDGKAILRYDAEAFRTE